ncbi:MAG TPA: recombinase family protein [Fimbriimonadaceae bacterium]|nr:recombinase family protein [Fimbriimonadaceae bacterium]
MDRAIAYIRVSTDRQAKDGTSLVTQERRVYENVARKGYDFDRLFVEEGESAKTDNRPVLQEMLAYCAKNRGRIKVLIFPKVDRFARYAEDYHYLKGYLRKLGIRVESIDEHFDDSPSGRFFESMLAASAQFDNDVRSERARNGTKESVAEGRYLWPPKGYRRTFVGKKATCEPDPATAPIVTQAFERLASGEYRLKDARAWLAGHGIKLCRSQIYEMVHNKIYIGIIEAFGITRPAAPPLLPLVSEKVFYKAQAAIRPRKPIRTYQRDHPDFPLRGTLRCPKGHFLTASWAQGRRQRYPYYRCKHCPQVNWRKELVEERLVELLATLKKNYPMSPLVRTQLIDAWRQERSACQDKRQRIEKEMGRLADLQGALAIKSAQGVLPDHLAKDQIAELGQKIADLRLHLQETQEQPNNIKFVIERSETFLSQLDHFWLEASMTVQKHVLRFFFPEGATVDPTGQIRTPQNSPFEGLRRFASTQLSDRARPADKSANHLRTLLVATHDEFLSARPLKPKERHHRTSKV